MRPCNVHRVSGSAQSLTCLPEAVLQLENVKTVSPTAEGRTDDQFDGQRQHTDEVQEKNPLGRACFFCGQEPI